MHPWVLLQAAFIRLPIYSPRSKSPFLACWILWAISARNRHYCLEVENFIVTTPSAWIALRFGRNYDRTSVHGVCVWHASPVTRHGEIGRRVR